jgi:regulator of protease activity HflC (stomatin/prohibitin superfamily)
MAQIRNLAFLAQLRSDASNHVIRYRKGQVRQSGRGLVFWFRPETASIAEIPMDDRETTLFVSGRSQDFQQVAVQGMLTWHVVDPELLAQRVDFSIGLFSGKLQGEPIERIETRLAGLVNQAALQYLAEAPVRALLDVGIEPLRERLEAALAAATSLTEIGIAVVAVRVTSLAPSNELERALQTPTFEALQQKADEAMFERRALAVEKELISEEAENARNRATGLADANQIEADAEAGRIRVIGAAKAEADGAHIAIYRDLPPAVLMGLAARELAGKLDTIEHVNVTPDLLASLMSEFRKVPPALVAAS